MIQGHRWLRSLDERITLPILNDLLYKLFRRAADQNMRVMTTEPTTDDITENEHVLYLNGSTLRIYTWVYVSNVKTLYYLEYTAA
jgi:hypothetical protein